MTSARPVGVVVDTMVISWLLYERPGPVADRYRALIETKTSGPNGNVDHREQRGAHRVVRVDQRRLGHPVEQNVLAGDPVQVGDQILLLRALLRPGPSGWCRSGRGRRRPGRAGRPSR